MDDAVTRFFTRFRGNLFICWHSLVSETQNEIVVSWSTLWGMMKVYWLDFSLHFRSCCLPQVRAEACIEMGNDESHFYVSLIVRDKVTRPSVHRPQFFTEEKGEPKRIRTEVPLLTSLKPVLNWANVCSPEHTSDTSTNYDSFLNWTFSSPNMVQTVQTLLHSQLACNEMQASARTCGRRAADSMIENVG